MASFTIEMAMPTDDAELRTMMAVPMGKEYEITLRREPSFFYGVDVLGHSSQVIVARDQNDGKPVGVATRSIKPAFVNGQVAELGYIGGLRLRQDVQNRTLLARGYQKFRQLHEARPADAYVTTIIDGNGHAERLLTSGRAGLPRYAYWGQYITLAICPGRKKKELAGQETSLSVCRGSRDQLDEIVDCLRRNGSRKQFYPAWSSEDFCSDRPYLRGFNIENFFVARESGKVVGVIGAWDQSSFKQSYVTAYRGKVRLLRPWYNLAAKLCGSTPLPPQGSRLNSFFASHIAVDDDNTDVYRVLLRAVYNWTVGHGGYSYFLVGLHERDPFLAITQEYRSFAYPAKMYVVDWGDWPDGMSTIDQRVPPYLELATL
ncbi:MAG: hypothetical protein PVH19_06910 [Planctomycetia bacterium]|jgi:hypothetical protein